MKKYLISAILSTQLMFGAGIPVIDAVGNAQTLAQNIKEIGEWAEEAKRWADTAIHYKSQLTAYENELLSKTGIRDAVSFVKDLDRLRKYAESYGDDYLDLAKAMANPKSRVGNQAKNLFEKYNVFDECNNSIYKDWQKEACQNKLTRQVTQIATVQESNKMVDETSKNLEELSKKISNTQDIKESQDIANAINMELAQLQVVSMKMDMMEKQNQAVEKAEKEQQIKQYKSTLNNHYNWSNFDWTLKNK
ncbi:type IV secretion system protein [Aliarcobacter lanthieri]|uniref:type IV secretion system protein n=1 Tax=Aliarcobacter lanthieri TaxID=1355374 RepID=UPI003AA805F9